MRRGDQINTWYNSHLFKNNGYDYDIVVLIALVVMICGVLYIFRKPLKEFFKSFSTWG